MTKKEVMIREMNTHEKWNISAVKKICVDKQIKIIDLFNLKNF